MVKGIGAMAVSRKQKENAPMKFTQEMGAPIAESGDLLGSPTTRDGEFVVRSVATPSNQLAASYPWAFRVLVQQGWDTNAGLGPHGAGIKEPIDPLSIAAGVDVRADYKPGVGHRDVLVAPEDAQKQAFKAWNQLQPTGQQSGGNALNQLQPTGQQSGGHAWHQPQPTGQQSGGHAWNKPQPIGQQSGGNAWKQPRPSGQQSGGNAWHQPQPTGQQVGGNASKNVSVLDEAEKAERRKRIAQVELEKFGTNDFEKNAIKGDEEEQEGKFDPFKYVDKHNRGGW
ncbi:hypothetical protein GGR56DRAFT_212938 [Xylariaceae sp. FL0804]|nr:hypothetical protein GGR56DRAFT_212938 [Xylariaceae sp. FL0804]